MTVQTVKLAGKKFVILAEDDFRDLQRRADQSQKARNRKKTGRRPVDEDAADAALVRRRLANPKEKPIPYEQARAAWD